MRGCFLSVGCLGLLVGYAACGTGIAAGIYHIFHHGPGSDRLATILPFDTHDLAVELRRCRDLGIAAYNDIRCEVAWKEDQVRLAGCPIPAIAHASSATGR